MTPAAKARLPHDVEQLAATADRLVFSRRDGGLLGLLPSGREAWVRELEGCPGLALIHASDGSLFVEADPVLRIDGRSGRTLASRGFGPSPSLDLTSGVLTCRSESSDELHALDPETLESRASCADPEGSVSLHEGFFCESTPARTLVLRDPRTGLELARVAEPEGAGHVHHALSVCFFSTAERVAVDLGSGRTLWRHPMEADLAGASWWPLRFGRSALVLGNGIAAYDLASGERRSRAFEGRTDLRCWRKIVDGRLLFDTGSALHVVDAATGTLLDSHDTGLAVSIASLVAGGRAAVVGHTKNGFVELHVLHLEPLPR